MTIDVTASQEDVHEMVKEMSDDEKAPVLDHLAEQTTTESEEPPVDMGDEQDGEEYPLSQEKVISQISMSMEWLRDLHGTVERRGVASTDIKALHEIRASLEEVGVVFEPTPALEHYPLSAYTAERSSVNLDVGLESISRTIIQTIKNWIRKLIEYIKKMYQWVKRHLKRETQFEKAFSVYPELIATARDGRKRLEKSRSNPPSREYLQAVEKKQTSFLTDGDLKRSPMQLAALNVTEYADKARHLEKDTLAFTRMVEQQVDQVEAALTQHPQSIKTIEDTPSMVGKMVLDEIGMFEAEMPQRDYLKRHVKLAYFDLPLKSAAWKLSPYDYLTDMHEELVKQLSKVQQLRPNGPVSKDAPNGEFENIDYVSEVLGDISKNVDHLVRMSRFFYQFNRVKRETLKRLFMLENEVFSKAYRDAKTNAVDARQQASFDKIRDEVQKRVEELIG